MKKVSVPVSFVFAAVILLSNVVFGSEVLGNRTGNEDFLSGPCFDLDASESAAINVRRLRDNRVVASRTGNNPPSTYSYPNDRVARGEAYRVEISYYTGTCNGGVTEFTTTGGLNGPVESIHSFSADGTSHSYSFSWQNTVSNSPSFSNVWFDVRGKNSSKSLTSIKLPIGAY